MQESFEELQQLFVDMFHGDLVGEFGFGGPPPMVHRAQTRSPPSSSRSTSAEASPPCNGVNKRCSSAMGSEMPRRSELGRREEATWTQEDTSTGGGMSKKQRQSHGVSCSSV
jgi:hypothetical protein